MNTLNAHDMNQNKTERLARIKTEEKSNFKNEMGQGDVQPKNESIDDTESTLDGSYITDSNEPCVDFLKFINNEDAYLMFKNKNFPLEDGLRNEGLGYPLGVTYDEVLKDWIICDRDNNKILCINMEKLQIKVTETPRLKNPTALMVYEQGKSVAVLCSEDRRSKFSIFIYNLEKQFLSSFASYTESIYDMKSQMRGLAKSYGKNIISLDQGSYNQRGKRLRVFKNNIGSHSFEMKRAVNPSFLASYRSTVAVSDLGVNEVFLFNLNDDKWKDVKFAPLHVISTIPDMPLNDLANSSGFKFVSGLQFDTNGFLLIGDAKGHTIKLFDADGEFLHRVSSDFAMPFMSTFHINQDGNAMILDVHAARKLHWAQLKPIKSVLPWREASENQGGGMRRRPPMNRNAHYRDQQPRW